MTTLEKKPINVKVNSELKTEAEKLFNELGLTMTSAITVFLQQSVSNQAIPFQIKKPNAETLKAIKDIEDGNLEGGFSSVKDLLENLNAWYLLHIKI